MVSCIEWPASGLHLNLEKCEAFWPTGDQSFPELPSQITCLAEGTEFMGSPVYSKEQSIKSSVTKHIKKVIEAQSHLSD